MGGSYFAGEELQTIEGFRDTQKEEGSEWKDHARLGEIGLGEIQILYVLRDRKMIIGGETNQRLQMAEAPRSYKVEKEGREKKRATLRI